MDQCSWWQQLIGWLCFKARKPFNILCFTMISLSFIVFWFFPGFPRCVTKIGHQLTKFELCQHWIGFFNITYFKITDQVLCKMTYLFPFCDTWPYLLAIMKYLIRLWDGAKREGVARIAEQARCPRALFWSNFHKNQINV